MQLIVLGMHRSGTSAVTRLLNMSGAYFGPEGMAIASNEENPKGFWERRDLRQVCDGLLQDSGFDWWKVAGFTPDSLDSDAVLRHRSAFTEIVTDLDAHRPWVIKEPRLSLLLPALRPALELPVCIHVSREPVEVARSLAARNGFPLPVGVALWERYTLSALAASADVPRYHVRHADVLADPVGVVRDLLHWLEERGVGGLRCPDVGEIGAFIDPMLHRQHASSHERDGMLNVRQAELATAIDEGTLFESEWSERRPSPGGTETLDSFERRRAREQEVEELARQVRVLEEEQAGTTARLEAAQAEAQHVAATDELLRAIGDQLHEDERALELLSRSRLWHVTERLMVLRQRVTPGRTRQTRGQLVRIRDDLAEVLRKVDARSSARPSTPDAPGTQSDQLPGGIVLHRTGPARSGPPSRPKVAVIAWDVGHNPLGRAYTMAELLARRFDVELWGAQFDRYGSRLWAPLQRPDVPIHHFRGAPLPAHLDAMEAVAETIDADAIWVSKPRFPSMALGVLAKRVRNRPLVVDVDDHELAFFGETEGLGLSDLLGRPMKDLTLPFERDWTRVCEPLIAEADAVTVSNTALQQRHGGVLVPHARDEKRFDPGAYDREATRASLGIGPQDRLLLFGGTPRVHKGVIDVLEALQVLGDPRCKLALVGTSELAELGDRVGELRRWIVPLPYQHFSELAPIVGAADLACVLQDPSHPVSMYQMPAKVTDALAMAVPCLVADVPPLRPLIDADIVHVHEAGTPLHERIASIFDDPVGTAARAGRGRAFFLEHLSYDAVCDRVAPVFDGLLEETPPLSRELGDLVDAPRRVLPGPGPSGAPVRARGSRRWNASPDEQFDLVMFWKQNDSSIYGRRQDMFLEYLRRSGRFSKIVHFDNPMSPEKLYGTYRRANGIADQSGLVVRQTVRRLLHRRDENDIIRRTFLHAGPVSSLLRLPGRSSYADYVASVLHKAGVGNERLTVFWVYPTNEDLPGVIDQLQPDVVLADVVDDNRTWHLDDPVLRDRAEDSYREILRRSDIVVANCEPVAGAMREFAPEVHLIPNGCEVPDGSPAGDPPTELSSLNGPVIGYVGNLSDRIDIDLLDELARARPDWEFVFVGSAHRDQATLRLDRHRNAHFLGVKPYEEAKQILRHFDVALIPHLDNAMTRSMNPLKAFVYCAAGVPVVSTPIANLGELEPLITVASGRDGFLRAIEDALAEGRRPVDLELLAPHDWTRRARQALALIDAAAGADRGTD